MKNLFFILFLFSFSFSFGQNEFITTWKTDNPGTSNNTSITIPVYSTAFNYDVDWDNDGTFDQFGITGGVTHDFGTPGTYTIAIRGQFTSIYFNGIGDKLKIININQWGNIPWFTMFNAFNGCQNLTCTATDSPNLTNMGTMSGAFYNAILFNGDLSNWDVSNVNSMSYAFGLANNFNSDLSNWNVSNVTNMNGTFWEASSFNTDISTWNVNSVTNMERMFHNATSFNQDLSNWNMSNVTNTTDMFLGATLSSINYDNLLIGWSSQVLQSGLNFNGGNSTYCIAATERSDIIANNSWTITDAGQSCPSPNAFITTWRTDNPGTSNNTSITIPIYTGLTYNYDVDWDNDGTFDQFGISGSITHDFGTAGTYTIAIQGQFPGINFNNIGDKDKIIDINQWGNINWVDMNNAYFGCSNLICTATDSPDFSNVTQTIAMFLNATNFTGDLSNWDMNTVTNTFSMFFGAQNFISDLSNWNTNNFTNTADMFNGATSFNSDLSNWNVGNVTDMRFMFSGATSFNSDLSTWNVSNVTNMKNMFSETTNFNSDLSNWNVSNVTDMSNLFYRASNFNSDLSNWDVSNVNNMFLMFREATNFTSDLSNWNVSNVTDMEAMFMGVSNFNSDLSNWNVSNVNNMLFMFFGASSFNSNIGNWDVSNVTHMNNMFENAVSFDQNLGNWNMSSVTNVFNMFNGVTLSTPNYDSLLIGWSSQILQPNLNFNGGNSQFSCAVAPDRNAIISNYGWTINDGGITNISTPLVDAGLDQTICIGGIDTIFVNGSSSTGSGIWNSSGDGSFSNQNSLNTFYLLGLNDKLNNSIDLYLTSSGNGGCNTAVDTISIIFSMPENAYFEFNDFCFGEANNAINISSPGGLFLFSPDPFDGTIINSSTGELSNYTEGTVYSIEYTTNGICPNSYKNTVYVSAIPNVDLGLDTTLNIASSLILTNLNDNQQIKLLASDGVSNDEFGNEADIEGNTIVIGARRGDDNGTDAGAVYVYEFDGSNWIENQKIIASDGIAGDFFGQSVSIQGKKIAIGARGGAGGGNISPGKVYIYSYNGVNWIEEQIITPFDGVINDNYGNSVDIYGDHLAVGAFGNGVNGATYFYRFDGNNWNFVNKVTASNQTSGNFFGGNLTIYDDKAIIGSRAEDTQGLNAGAAYYFRFNGSIWVEEQIIFSSDLATTDNFGSSLDLFEDRIIIGSNNKNGIGITDGAAYIFEYNGNQFIETQKITGINTQSGDKFGGGVSLNKNNIIVGASRTSTKGIDAGTGYHFNYDGLNYIEISEFYADDAASGKRFGTFTALNNNLSILSSRFDDDNGIMSGAAYVHPLPLNNIWNTGSISDSLSVFVSTDTSFFIQSTNASGCISTDTINITLCDSVYANAGNDTSICSNINSIELNGFVFGNAGYNWSSLGDGGFNNLSILNPIYTFGPNDINSGNTKLIIESIGNCESSTDTITVNISNAPTVDAGLDLSVCDSFVSIIGSSTNSINSYWFSTGDGLFIDSSSLSTNYIFGSNDIISGNVTIILESIGVQNCSNVLDTVNILVLENISVEIGNDTTLCADQNQLILTATSTTNEGLWTTNGNGTFTSNITLTTNYQINNTDSIIKIFFTSTNSAGCLNSIDSISLSIIDTPFANAGIDTIIEEGESVQLNGSTSSSSYNWAFDPSLSDINILNPVVTPNITTEYIFTSTNDICSISDTVLVTVNPLIEEPLEIRNLVTPNDDGKNDFWTVSHPELLDDCEVIIMNRWGNILHNSTGYNNDWGATYQGKIVPDGNYIYIINCEGQEQLTGSITVVKNKF